MFRKLFGPDTPSTLLEAAFRDVDTMLEQSARMLDVSLPALLENRPLEADLQEMDDVVDEGERMVRRTILEHLSVNPRQDLVASLILVSMVQDAERIGDMARGIGELLGLAGGPRTPPWTEEIRAIVDRLRPQFDVCKKAFHEGDEELASQVAAAHLDIKPACKELTEKVASSDLSADMAVVYAGAARILRRISAHLANIASTVIQPYDRIRHGDEDI